ncbi:UNVERIFIED_CONTAM: hypothetical protein Slati_1333400 [Sesamum latifolium]|uniref:DUF4283 domain-containing protein n=1 Tax=Sesamum latifolium TaxID=2727402 RepID=A0AAW2XHT5_9LAMI
MILVTDGMNGDEILNEDPVVLDVVPTAVLAPDRSGVDVASRFHREFYNLATRVIDNDDSEAMAALVKLKERWRTRPPLTLKLALWIPRLPTAKQAAMILHQGTPSPTNPDIEALQQTRVLEPQPHADRTSLPAPLTVSPTATLDFIAMSGLNEGLGIHGLTDSCTPSMTNSSLPSATMLQLPTTQHSTPPPVANRISDMVGVENQQHTTSQTATLPNGVSAHGPPMMPASGIFIGNVRLNTSLNSVDKITDAFHNSSRKILPFIPPSLQNKEIIVRPSLNVIHEGSRRWSTTAVGYFLGKRPYFHHLNEHVRTVWPAVRDVTATANGFFFFQFKTVAAMEEVIDGGPWLFQGQPIVLQKWEPGMVLRKLKHTQVPVWIKHCHLPVELWTNDGLSTIASGIGKPLYPDAITRACTRLDFTRVCVMLDISSKLPKYVIIMLPKEDGSEAACKRADKAPTLRGDPVTRTDLREEESGIPSLLDDDAECSSRGPNSSSPLPVSNVNAAIWNVRGLNRRDHRVAISDLIAEFQLQFIGLLETRVSARNIVTCVQMCLSHTWKWFEDYARPGTRIWLAWKQDEVEVAILTIHTQLIHCRVFVR